jgi:hypothetical protein
MSAETIDGPVAWSKFTRDLGLSRTVRQNILDEGLVKPVAPPSQGHPTMIPPDEAERIRRAVTLAALAGLAVIVVLRLLDKSGASVTPDGLLIPVNTP